MFPHAPCSLVRFTLDADGTSALPFATENFAEVRCVAHEDVRVDAAPLFSLLDSFDFDRVLVSLSHAARTVTPWLQEYRIRPPQGGLRWLRSCLVPHADGLGRVSGYGLIADITAEKATREELLSLCAAGAVGVFRCDPQGRFLDANARFANICGYGSPEELLRGEGGASGLDRLCPEEHATLLRVLGAHGAIQRYALELRTRDGACVWVSLNVRAVRDSQGRMTCCEGYCADITGRVTGGLAQGWRRELGTVRFGEGPRRASDTRKPAGDSSTGGLCHVLSYVRDTIAWRMVQTGQS